MFRFKQNELWNENEKHADGLLGKGSHHVALRLKKEWKQYFQSLVTRKKKIIRKKEKGNNFEHF